MTRAILVVDDDKQFCDTLEMFLEDTPVRLFKAYTGKQGLEICRTESIGVVLLDENLPDSKGLELCEPILASNEHVKIIFITALPSYEHAVKALRRGAYDYLAKPVKYEELHIAVNRALQACNLEWKDEIRRFQDTRESDRHPLIGMAGGLNHLSKILELSAENRSPVLITGETGTGKSAIAKAIHSMNSEKGLPYIATNCAALPESLIESELFGHERGSFTGATSTRKGLFELAEGGTLFLDEIGELPANMQSKLLGVLDDGTFKRIGSRTIKKADVRIIAATNIDINEAIKARHFRKDLYYRINVLRIDLPPLRDRSEDIEEFCNHFITGILPDQRLVIPCEEMELLKNYGWPGNVRELKNVIERAVILRAGDTLYPGQLLQGMDIEPGKGGQQPGGPALSGPCSLADAEKHHIRMMLKECDHNHTHAAKLLGISRSTLIRKVSLYNISSGDSK